MYRVAIVPLSLGGADLRLAHKAEREAARAWNIVVTWGKAELAAGRWPNAYDLKRRLLALPAGERPELHTHSLQEICFDYEAACKTTKANKDAGRRARYPHQPKAFRPVSFSRNFAWSVKHAATGDRLKLSFGKSRAYVALPEVGGGPQTWGEVLLCWNGKGFELHVAYQVPEPVAHGAGPRPLAGAIDPGIIHAMACVVERADGGVDTLVISGRQARSVKRLRNKAVGELARLQARCHRGSRRWRKLQRAKARATGKARRRLRDIDHKTSRLAADFFNDHGAQRIYLGDVSGIERKTKRERRARRHQRQQLSQWGRGRQERYLGEKARATIVKTSEAHTSQTCPSCGTRRKVAGRTYRCRECGFTWHRDGVGALNILDRGKFGVLAPASHQAQGCGGLLDRLTPVTYRQPSFDRLSVTLNKLNGRRAGRGDGVAALNRASARRAVMSGALGHKARRHPAQPAAEGASVPALAEVA